MTTDTPSPPPGPLLPGAHADPSTPPPSPPAAPRPRRRSSIRPLVLRLHFYAGILVAPLLVIACVTGLLYTTMPQVEPLVHRKELHVDAPAGARRIPLIDQVRAARAAYPQGTISSVRVAPERDRSTRVNLAVPGVAEGYQRTVFVDPYTGRVQGNLRTLGEWLPVRVWFDDLHRNLHLGDVGRLYSETAASWLWVVVLGGLYLTWRRRRDERRRRPAAPKAGTPPRVLARLRTLRWHRTIGVVAAVGLLGLSATGLTWSKHAGENVSELRSKLSWQTPTVDTGAGAAADEHAGHAGHGAAATGAAGGDHELQRVSAIDDAVRAAGTEGLAAPLVVTPPAAEGGWQVQEDRRRWPERQDAVAVNRAGTAVTDVSRFADWPFAAKLTSWGVDAHMGLLFGIVNQIVLAALALALLTLIVLGYRMWWQRRPRHATRARPGKPIPRGAWRHLPWPTLLPIAVVVAAIGWFVPLLGITLVAFLVLDAAIGLARRTRAAAR
jgi:uncharacterized iron-regulated membrane protein